MWRMIPRKTSQTLRKIHTNMTPHINPQPPTPQDWLNFVLSSTNCVIIISILWGFESYNEKMILIQNTNDRINELCMAYRKLEKNCEPLTRQLTKDVVNPNLFQKR